MYTDELLHEYIAAAENAGLDEIWLLEHTHCFREFAAVYEPIAAYNDYQRQWLSGKFSNSIQGYLAFAKRNRGGDYPVKVRFGLEVCYIPEREDKLANVLDECELDFYVGSVHYVDGWGFDHRKQKELWGSKDIYKVYRRYYEIMFDLCECGLFEGVAHPDSIKCFGYAPAADMREYYDTLAMLLQKHGMYAENSGGLHLNYSPTLELGLNSKLLAILKENGVQINTASDAHKSADVGANIRALEAMLK